MKLDRLNRPESLADMASRELRAAIVDGRLKLGDQVSELRLSEMLGISKTPVREALLTLKREGLVKIDPQKATSIFHIDQNEIEAIRAFRELLEVRASQNAFAGDRTAFANGIGEVIEKMRVALGEGDRAEYRVLDAQFHDIILENGGNSYLSAAYKLVATKIGALRTRAQDSEKVVNSSMRMHTTLHELIEQGNVTKFCQLLRLHINNTGNDYMIWLNAQQD
ncbi:GntR family transcriptional regulator [Pararhizobium sp. IMCC21322]|uniref:GntR family transcriptional regulator n=1 Tax=Pararhizobium sp. IMCC21322 TaxID=3067903 RepID=UPI0027424063|nr:GntR family transcriptional regulator [Pararhizobium sp. IMCC21322]